jgi:hypothetical protein
MVRSLKPDSGHVATISITVWVRRASWNAMKPRIQCVLTQWKPGFIGSGSGPNAVKAPLRDLAWLGVAAERGVGACNRVLRMFYVGWLRRVRPGVTVGGSAADAAGAP